MIEAVASITVGAHHAKAPLTFSSVYPSRPLVMLSRTLPPGASVAIANVQFLSLGTSQPVIVTIPDRTVRVAQALVLDEDVSLSTITNNGTEPSVISLVVVGTLIPV